MDGISLLLTWLGTVLIRETVSIEGDAPPGDGSMWASMAAFVAVHLRGDFG